MPNRDAPTAAPRSLPKSSRARPASRSSPEPTITKFLSERCKSIVSDPSPLLTKTQKLLRRHGLRARKGLGQHFLINPAALQIATTAAELSDGDTVVEVGPGLGVLTEELAKSAGKVIAVEIDPGIASILNQRFASTPSVTVIHGDVLELNIKATLEQFGASGTDYKVVANLPYYVAAPTIRRFLEAEVKPQIMVLMGQKEVAENMVAEPGHMSIFSVSVQLYGKPSIAGYVPAEDFYPPPKVDSAMVRIDVYEKPAIDVNIEGFFHVVKAGFAAPRKQLRNSLAQGLKIENAASATLLERSGIDPQRRAQTLTLQEWGTLSQAVISSEGKEVS